MEAVTDTPPAPPAAEPDQLTPYQRRKRREEERERKAAERKARRAVAKAGDDQVELDAEPEAPSAPSPEKLKPALTVWVRLMHRVAGWCCLMFGGELAALTPAEVDDQAAHWLPWALAFPWFRTTVMWCAAPVLFLDLVARKFQRKAGPAQAAARGEPPK